MAEVRLAVELAHPPERVWQALPEARLLGAWFMPTDLEPRQGARFSLDPGNLAGLLGPVSAEAAAGATSQFSFQLIAPVLGLAGASEPTDCRIDGQPCGRPVPDSGMTRAGGGVKLDDAVPTGTVAEGVKGFDFVRCGRGSEPRKPASSR